MLKGPVPSRRRSSRRRIRVLIVGVVAGLSVPAVVGVATIATITSMSQNACDPGASGLSVGNLTGPAVPVDQNRVPAGPVAGADHNQLIVAATIMAVAHEAHLSARDQQIGVMTALGESDLGGDPTAKYPNGDGDLGIFQQRGHVGWYADGKTVEENTKILNDPVYASRTFYLGHDVAVSGPSPAGSIRYHIPGLVDVKNRDTLEPTIAAHKTQRNADPYYYAKYWDRAGTIVAAIAGSGALTKTPTPTASPSSAALVTAPALHAASSAPLPSAVATASVVPSTPANETCGGASSPNVADGQIVGAVDPNCPGGDISGFPNGQIPIERLCPLWGVKDHWLRADAANGFNKMSQAYAARFGEPICVTDSYRPYAVQVALKRQKPRLAATPGKSNHGWARATDLCGGIQDFGTSEHVWMQQNAPKYGWCDPPWARSSGSKPEPWHWEMCLKVL